MKRLTSNTPLTEAEAMNLSLTNLYARLKEYEDTGMEPEEAAKLLREAIAIKKELDEYTTAKREGRQLILPCKVGDTVFAIKDRRIYIVDVIGFRVHDWTGLYVLLLFDSRIKNGSYEFRIEEFGKTVFLNREEAEAALRGGADNG